MFGLLGGLISGAVTGAATAMTGKTGGGRDPRSMLKRKRKTLGGLASPSPLVPRGPMPQPDLNTPDGVKE